MLPKMIEITTVQAPADLIYEAARCLYNLSALLAGIREETGANPVTHGIAAAGEFMAHEFAERLDSLWLAMGRGKDAEASNG